MCIGIKPENFNPGVLYVLKKKFAVERAVPHHSHDFATLIYVLSGACTYQIDGLLYPVKKGDLLVCNPGRYHGKVSKPEEEMVELHIGINNLCLDGLPKECILPPEANPLVGLGKYEQDFFKCCADILLEQEKDEPGNDLVLKALVMKLIVLILRATHNKEERRKQTPFSFESYEKASIVNTIVSFVNENYMNEISLEKISKNMYLSPVYISKIFKEELGESPINYLIKVRLSKACALLEEGHLSVKEVAKNVGYDDAYYFSKLFKKYYKIPPSLYRKETALNLKMQA